MTEIIHVTPEHLEDLATDISHERETIADIFTKIEQRFSEVRFTINSPYAKWYDDYIATTYHLNQYIQDLVDLEEALHITAQQMRMADSKAYKAKSIGFEFLPINDLKRLFGQYDPLTGKRIDSGDRWKAMGWTALNFVSMGLGTLIKASSKAVKTRKQLSKFTKAEIETKNFRSVDIIGHVEVMGKQQEVTRRIYQWKHEIDLTKVDKTGKTNLRRMQKGDAPIGADGSPIELHHLIQKEPGTIVEIPYHLHKKYYNVIHGLVEKGRSFRNDPVLRNEFNNFRRQYWRWRAKEIQKVQVKDVMKGE